MSDGLVEPRRATAADVGAVRDLTRTAYAKWVDVLGSDPKPMLTDYAQAVRAHKIDLLDIDGALVGLIEMATKADHLLIVNVAVLPGFQKRGLGRLLLAHAERIAASLGLAEIRLYTNALMASNLALYSKLSYREDRRETNARGVVVHMRKSLPGSTMSGA